MTPDVAAVRCLLEGIYLRYGYGTSLFRDPPFFRALRGVVVPGLRTFPFLNVWTAGCASGEEAYSPGYSPGMLFEEEGLDRTRIYATDLSRDALASARSGDSLDGGSVLGLGGPAPLNTPEALQRFEPIDERLRIHRRRGVSTAERADRAAA